MLTFTNVFYNSIMVLPVSFNQLIAEIVGIIKLAIFKQKKKNKLIILILGGNCIFGNLSSSFPGWYPLHHFRIFTISKTMII